MDGPGPESWTQGSEAQGVVGGEAGAQRVAGRNAYAVPIWRVNPTVFIIKIEKVRSGRENYIANVAVPQNHTQVPIIIQFNWVWEEHQMWTYRGER